MEEKERKTHTDIRKRSNMKLDSSLWSVPVCFLGVCDGCFGDWSVACGMCRSVFYGCVSVASEIGR